MKKVIALMLALTLALSFSGCKKNESEISNVGSDPQIQAGELAPGKDADKTEMILESAAILNNESGIPSSEDLFSAAEKCPGSKYICYENEGEKASLYSYSRDDYSALFSDAPFDDVFKEIGFEKETDIVSRIEKNAILAVECLTDREGTLFNEPSVGENTYLAFNNTGLGIAAFGDICGLEMLPSEYFNQENLKLVITDPQIISLVSSKTMAQSLCACAAVVKADVTCVKNDGAFSSISWIPEKGTSKSITFTVTFMNYLNGETHNLLINDISAK